MNPYHVSDWPALATHDPRTRVGSRQRDCLRRPSSKRQGARSVAPKGPRAVLAGAIPERHREGNKKSQAWHHGPCMNCRSPRPDRMINACRKRGDAAALGLDLLGHAGVPRARKRIATLRACDGAEKLPKGAIMGYFWIKLRLAA